MRELVYYVAVSLDGFIAGPDGEFDAFLAEGDHRDVINERFGQTIPTDMALAQGVPQDQGLFQTVLMGWNTYAVGLPYGVTSPYRHLEQIVFSATNAVDEQSLRVTSDDPVTVVRELKRQDGGAIWLCGGGALAATLVDEIDRLVLKRNPVVLGSGVALFGDRGYRPTVFRHLETTAFQSGVVFSEYVRQR